MVGDHPLRDDLRLDELTGAEFLKAASNVDYAALMGVLDNHMSCIKAVCLKEYDAVMSQIHALR